MRIILPLFLIVGFAYSDVKFLSDEQMTMIWTNYKELYGKSYSTADLDNAHMLEFLKTHKTVREHNAAFSRGEKSYSLSINHLSDLLPEEKYPTLGLSANASLETTDEEFNYTLSLSSLPNRIDWRERGYVTEVKNQGNCGYGTCYIFAATGALEGQMKRKTGRLISLSEQDIVDCSSTGCNGGWASNVFMFIRNRGGIMSERSYPYVAQKRNCKFDRRNVVAQDRGFQRISVSENQLMIAVATQGPIAVSIHVEGDFYNYGHGVYDGSSCRSNGHDLNHAVLVVGYGTESGKNYWIIKNSWGNRWGENGYMKMVRGKNCAGVADVSVFPLV